MNGRAAAALVLALVGTTAGTTVHGQSPAAALPEGPGAAVTSKACLGCHEADLIVSQRLASAGWDREIAKMERWGAKVPAEDRPVLLSYLATHFGVRPTRAHDPRAVTTGEAIFVRACRACHDDDLSAQQQLSEAAWGRTIDKMVRWGATVSADEKPALATYLASRWGPP